MSTRRYRRLLPSAFGLLALLSNAAHAASGTPKDWAINIQPPATPIAQDIMHLHMMVFYICIGIFVVVAGFMFYSIIFHRKSRGYRPATFHESTTVEIIWTIIPFVILIAMAIPATSTLLKIVNTRPGAQLLVKVTGYQWKWRYSYPKQHIAFFSNLSTPIAQIENKEPKGPHYLLQVDHPLVLPVNEKVRFLITSNDVIHGWWVPALGIQDDAVPGFIHEGWATITKPGTYRGQCAQLCGQGHAFMPIVVKAVPQAEFVAWVKKQQAGQQAVAAGNAAATNKVWTKADLMAKGRTVYQANCAVCHQGTGQGVPGTFPPITTGRPFSAASSLTTKLAHRGFYKGGKITEASVKQHIGVVLHGIPGTPMPAWGPQLSNAAIAAVITYERNAFGNHTGDVVQPSQVQAAR
ncbi:MAG: cytochrome c oxidase subunit II [Acidiferrobacteraceae bacterium]